MTFPETNIDISQMAVLFLKITFGTVNRLSNFNIDTDIIIKHIHSLDPNKTHYCGEIPIGMIELCTMSFSKPLHILSNNSVMNEYFPSEWEKANIPVQKKVTNK